MTENRSEPPPTPDELASRIDAAITLLAQTQRERDNLRIERDIALAEIDRLKANFECAMRTLRYHAPAAHDELADQLTAIERVEARTNQYPEAR